MKLWRKPVTEFPCLSPYQIRNVYYDIFLQSYTVLSVFKIIKFTTCWMLLFHIPLL